MATDTGTDGEAQNSLKRPNEDSSSTNGDEKRMKTEYVHNDPTLDNLFAPLPFETKDEYTGADFPLDTTGDLELPDFLSDKPAQNHTPGNGPVNTTLAANPGPATPNGASSRLAYTPGPNDTHATGSPAPGSMLNNSHNTGQYTPTASGLSRTTSTGKAPEQGQQGHMPTTPGPTSLYHSQSQQGISSTYPYQKTTAGTFPHQYRAPPNNTGTTPSGFKPGIRFDPKRSFPSPMAPSTSMGATYQGTGPGSGPGAGPNVPDKDKLEDPSKLNDALAAAGVDIQREEELLSTNYNRSALNLHQQQLANRQRQTYGQLNAFLHPYHVALFMNRTARENGVMQNFMVDPEMLEFMSGACKEWISNIVTKTVALAKHRRRGIPAFNPKNKAAGKQKPTPPSQRSEVSKELRNLALKQKESEERRVAKRALLGLEKGDEVAPDSANKAGAEETLHRAANATAAMMTMNPSRKKYSWMTSGAGNSTDESKSNGSKDSTSKQSSLIASRGDNGLRYREIRTGNMISSKDLLGVLEDERIGTSKAVVKGYARLKD